MNTLGPCNSMSAEIFSYFHIIRHKFVVLYSSTSVSKFHIYTYIAYILHSDGIFYRRLDVYRYGMKLYSYITMAI